MDKRLYGRRMLQFKEELDIGVGYVNQWIALIIFKSPEYKVYR